MHQDINSPDSARFMHAYFSQ